jgi:CHAT domain-containing protein
VQQAAQRLQAIHNAIEHKPSFDLEIAYYTAQADVAMHDSDPGESEKALVSAISQAESALTSLSSESDRRKWAEQTQSAYRDAVEFEIRHGNSAGALELWEWYRGAELKAHIDQWPDPSESKALPAPHVVTNHLPLLRDETVIVYGVFPDGIALWAYDDRGISLQWISAPLPAMQDQVVQFWQLCADPASDLATLHKVGGSLYQLLVAPIEDRLTAGRTIVFEPDDFLATVPWEALVDARGHYLAERSAVIVGPGLYRSQAMQLRSSVPITAEVPALVVSVAKPPEPDVPTLVDVDSEARAVADRFSSAYQLKGEDASLSTIGRELPGTLVFHFAGHAVASSQRSGLLLGKVESKTPASQRPHAQILSADTFPVAKTQNLQLAVLSACETAGGSRIAVAGNESLAETLVRANVPHVIASRWKVDSRETAEYMGAFYTELLAGNSVSQSIHKAQLTLASQSSSAHPYYWAAFELTGRN